MKDVESVRRHQGRQGQEGARRRRASSPSARSPTSPSPGTTRRKKTRDEETFELRQRDLRRLPHAVPGEPQGVRPALLLGRAPQRQPAEVREGRRASTPRRPAGREEAGGQGRQGQAQAGQAGQVADQRRLQRGARLRRGGEGRARRSGQLKTETGVGHQQEARPSPPPKKALLEACERYIKYVPKGDKRVEIAFKAANIYYRYNHFDEAVLRFSEIALNYPDYKFENGERAGGDRRQPRARLVQPAAGLGEGQRVGAASSTTTTSWPPASSATSWPSSSSSRPSSW